MKLLVIIALVVVPGCASTLPGRGDPTAATAAFSRAILHQLQGRHDDAIQEYDQAIRLRPEYAEAFNNRGAAYDSKREYNRAIEDSQRPDEGRSLLEKAVEICPRTFREYDAAKSDLDRLP